MTTKGPRILLIGGTYRALCLLERLLERGECVAAFIGQEGSSERDFCPEILELCSGVGIAARSGHKLGEETVRWLEDRVRPELAIAVGMQTEIPVAIGGNCRLGLVEVLDMFQSDSCPGVVLRQRGQEIMRRELCWPDDPDALGDTYLEMVEVLTGCVERFIDGLESGRGELGARVRFSARDEREGALEALVEHTEPGPETQRLERDLAAYLGADAVFALHSASDGFRVLARGLELDGAGIVCPGVVSSGALAGLRDAGAQPFFADVRPGRLTLDAESAADALDEDTRALLVAHALGQPAELDLLYGLAEERGLELIEDAGCALGARIGDSRLGRSPCACVFRLPLVRGASAGLLTLPAGLVERFTPLVEGLRIGDGAATLGRAALERADDRTAVQRAHASAYSSELSRYDAFTVPPTPEDALPTYTGYLLGLTRFARTTAEDLRKLLAEKGIETRRLQLPLGDRDLAGLPVADQARANGMLLPVHAELTEEQRDVVLDAIFGFAIG